MKIVFVDKINLLPEHIRQIQMLGNVKIYKDIPKNQKEVIKRIVDAKLIVVNWLALPSNIIKNANSLKYIIVPHVGYEWVDINEARNRAIKVLNCPTQNSDAVANLTIALIFAVTRKIVDANISLRNGKWDQRKYKGTELKNKMIGIIGNGNIGKKVGQITKLLGMHVKHVDSKTSKKELDNLITSSDIISLHVPLNNKTRHLLNERRLKSMKKGSYIINTARGALIDQKALIRLLKSNHFAGVALDVFEHEPPSKDSLNEIAKITKLPNVVSLPHIGFNTEETCSRVGLEIIKNVKSCIAGKPINVINE